MRVTDVLRGIRWYLRELTGESQYEHYVERHSRCHSDGPLLSRREFEHNRIDRGDVHPGSRCC